MIYTSSLESFPTLIKSYKVTRKTVWKIADPYNIIIYIKSGCCSIELMGEKFDLYKGDIFFIPADTVYLRKPLHDEFCEMVYLHFTLPSPAVLTFPDENDRVLKGIIEEYRIGRELTAASAYRSVLFLENLTKHCDKTKDIKKDIDEVLDTIYKRRVHSYSLGSSILSKLLFIMSDVALSNLINVSSSTPQKKFPKRLQPVILYIHTHYKEKIELEDLCDIAFVSKQMLSKDFKKHLGISPINYINNYKFQKARELLVNDLEMSVKEIGAELGFDDQCYFSRAFKKATGESPSEYRLRVSAFNEKQHIGKVTNKEV